MNDLLSGFLGDFYVGQEWESSHFGNFSEN
jgi:hypothetical protein